MCIFLKWFEELVDINIILEELVEILIMVGFEVEEIEDWSIWLVGVVLGKILEVDKYFNVNKFKVC